MFLNLYYLPKRSSKEIWPDPLTSMARNAEASTQTDMALAGISSDMALCSPERLLSCHSRAGTSGLSVASQNATNNHGSSKLTGVLCVIFRGTEGKQCGRECGLCAAA